jgi:ATP-dependent RNA helicase RhlE
LSFCDIEEKAFLLDIQKTIRQDVEVLEDHPFHSDKIANDPGLPVKKKRGGGSGGRGRRPSGGGGGGNTRPRKPHWKKGGAKKAA